MDRGGEAIFFRMKTEVDAMKEDEYFWDSITKHWKVYCEKHMIVNYVDRVVLLPTYGSTLEVPPGRSLDRKRPFQQH